MRIGIAFDLKTDFIPGSPLFDEEKDAPPPDLYEEYDAEETIEAISGALAQRGHEPVPLGGGRKFVTNLLHNGIDFVFNMSEGHGGRSREAHVPAVCEMLNVPYSGSDPLTLALTLDKEMTKRVVLTAGVATPKFAVVRPGARLARREHALAGAAHRGHRADPETAIPPANGHMALDDIEFPVLVKPVHEGSSVGVRKSSRASNDRELVAEIRRIHRDYDQPALIEKFVEGPEYTVGILGNGKSARLIGAMEIRPKRGAPEEFVYSLELKRNWREEVEYRVNPPMAPGARKALEDAARTVYEVLGCRDVSRLDFRMDGDGVPCFLEVNPLPGLNPESSDLPILAYGAGWTYDDLVGGVLDHALERCGKNPVL